MAIELSNDYLELISVREQPTKKSRSNMKASKSSTSSSSSQSRLSSSGNSSTKGSPTKSSSTSASNNGANGKAGTTKHKYSGNNNLEHFDIHDKLRELYLHLLIQDDRSENRVKLKSRSFVLEYLVEREKLNTIIINLYPGNKGYSLAFRRENLTLNNGRSKSESSPVENSNRILLKQQSNNGANNGNNISMENLDDCDDLIEIMRWPYEVGGLLESIDNEELPLLFMDLLDGRNVFYNGCVIVEMRDYRQSFQISNCCDTYYVLLRPTNQTLLADVNTIATKNKFNSDDKLLLESQLVLATAEPLCLDPNPDIGRHAINRQHMRTIWNTPTIRRQMKKFSQVAINRKRKLDQFTHYVGLELSDYLTRMRHRPRQSLSCQTNVTSNVIPRLPKRPSEVLKPSRVPNYETPQLKTPMEIDVAKYAIAHDRRSKDEWTPQLVEEYILETEREITAFTKSIYHIKLTIYQRPANLEYIGELYVDRDYQENKRNGEACQFTLGSQFNARRYVDQFIEIFTEEGQKKVKMIHIVPGKAPKVIQEPHRESTTVQQSSTQHIAPQNPSTAGVQLKMNMDVAPQINGGQLQGQNIQNFLNSSTTPVNPGPIPPNILAFQQANLLGLSNSNNNKFIQKQVNRPHQQIQQIFTLGTGQNISNVSIDGNQQLISQPLQPQTHLNIGNGSLLLVQQQNPSNPITNVASVRTAAVPQMQNSQITLVTQQPQQQQMTSTVSSTAAVESPIRSTNPEVDALMNSLIESSNQFQAAAASNLKQQPNSNNAAIISLLNSAPAAMTHSPVINGTLTFHNHPKQQTVLTNIQEIPSESQTPIISQPIAQSTSTVQNVLANHLRNIHGGGSNRIVTHGNLIAVTSVGQNLLSVQAPQTISIQTNPQNEIVNSSNVRVTMSALASQLASPPAQMSNSPLQPQTYGFTIASANSTGANLKSPPQTVLINNTGSPINVRSQQQTNRRDSIPIPSPGSADSNNSNSNMNFPLGINSILTTTSPPPVNNPIDNTPAIIDRFLANNSNQFHQQPSPSPSPGASQFASPSPKSNHILSAQVQSPAAVLSPISASPPAAVQQNTTTLNLQGINLQSLQGAISTFPGIQNVQVQIPGFSQPISLPISGTSTGQQQQAPTGLLVSVPVSSNTQSSGSQQNILNTVAQPTIVLSSTGPTAGNPASGQVLSVPLAQLVASGGVKGLNAHSIRSGANVLGGSSNIQFVSTLPRGVQLTTTGQVNSKPLRGIMTAQRANRPIIQNTGNVTNNNQFMLTNQQLQLKLRKPTPTNTVGVGQQVVQQQVIQQQLPTNPVTSPTTFIPLNQQQQQILINANVGSNVAGKQRRQSTASDLK